MAASTSAVPRDDGRFGSVDPQTKQWIEKLHNRLGANCCSISDGVQPEKVKRDASGSGFSVQIQGNWYEVPDHTVISDSNQLGFPIVWYS
ncbi:MAG TPA: hypothetical protein VM260_03355, partial [Pirellula sp.]|nr:hypothetical protein [Pirellula sp.]